MSIGSFISGIFGGKNEDKPAVQKDVYKVDPNAYQYGGRPGGANAASGLALAQGGANNAKQSEYGAQQENLYNYGVSGLQQANDSRGAQLDALALARWRATGAAPSIAQMQAARDMQAARAAQSSLAASARGPAALALAQQNAAGNISNAQANISGQAQIAAAQERLAAEQAYAQQAAGLRGADIGQAGTAFGAGAQSGQLGLGAGQLGLGYAGLANNIQQSQLAAQMNREAQTSANVGGAQNTAAAVGGQNAQMNQRNAEGLINGLMQGGAGILGLGGGGGKAVGGATHGGHPYLVGEQGPELIIPKRDGFVLTAPQTAFVRQTMTPQQARALGGDVSGYAREGGGAVIAPATIGIGGPALAQQQAAAALVDEARRADEEARRAAYARDVAGRPTDTGAGMILGNMIASGVYDAPGGIGAKTGQGSDPSGVYGGMQQAGVKTKAGASETAEKKPTDKPTASKSVTIRPFSELQQIGGVDARGYVPAQYVALPAREHGGSIAGYEDTNVMQPGSFTILAPGGGMDLMGSLRANERAGTSYIKSPGFAREDGGPVKGSLPERAGAAGAELGAKLGDIVAVVPEFVGSAQAALWDHSPLVSSLRRLMPAPAPAAAPAVVPPPAPRSVASDKTPIFLVRSGGRHNTSADTNDPRVQSSSFESGTKLVPKKKDDGALALASGGRR